MTAHREPVEPTGREAMLEALLVERLAMLEALLVERFAAPVPEWHPPPRPAEAQALRLVRDEESA